MSNRDELRDRIESVISDWVIPGVPPAVVAQAIVDEFGMTVEERIDKPGMRGINPVRRVIGKWEEQ